MIDIKLIRENKDLVKENIKKKFQDHKLPLVDEVTKLSNDEDTVILYTKLTREELEQNTYLAEAKQEGIEQGIKQCIEEGMNKKSAEIARKMLKQKIDIEMIQTITGFTIEELQKMKENID